MKPNYIAREHFMAHFPYLSTLFAIIFMAIGMLVEEMIVLTFIGVAFFLVAIIKIFLYYKFGRIVEFYDNYVITKSGILNRTEKKSPFSGIISLNFEQSLLGMIFDYGTIFVDVVWKHNIYLSNVVNPKGLRSFFEKYTNENAMDNVQTIVVER